MKVLILAAGFGTRLRPLTNEIPKSLLSLCRGRVIDEQITNLVQGKLSSIFVMTNNKFYEGLRTWLSSSKYSKFVTLIDNEIQSEESRRGAVGDLTFFIDKVKPDDDLLVLGSDNIFDDSFEGILNFFNDKKHFVVIAVHTLANSNFSKQPNEVTLEKETSKIVKFLEKPTKPQSSYIASLLYFFPKSMLKLPASYLAEGNNPDQAGNFISWLIQHNYPVFGYEMQGRRFDIGDPESYSSTQKLYPCRN